MLTLLVVREKACYRCAIILVVIEDELFVLVEMKVVDDIAYEITCIANQNTSSDCNTWNSIFNFKWLLGMNEWLLGMDEWFLGMDEWLLGMDEWLLGMDEWFLGKGEWLLGMDGC